jgi:glutathione S-transferase
VKREETPINEFTFHASRPAFPLVSLKEQTYIATVASARDTFDMIELIQFPWSPFCIVQRRILEFAGVRFKITNIPNGDRSLVWKLTKERYYGVPIIKDGKSVVFEMSEDSQVIAKYLDSKFKLGLFPRELEGVQSIIWRHIENEIEGPCFKLTDIHWRKIVPKSDHLRFLRHKERKFGRGCLDQWRAQEANLLRQLEHSLLPCEAMLMHKPFLLDDRPRFVDFDLYGMLGDFLYTGHYQLPAVHAQIRKWHRRMTELRMPTLADRGKTSSPS